MGRSVFASVAVPMLPYVPPNTADIMDIIFNAFGVTAPEIEDATKKAEGYWNLYRTALGGAYEEFRDKMQTIIDKAKTSRELVIDDEMITKLQIGQVYAIDNGMQVENENVEVTPAIIRSWFQTNGIQIRDSAVNTIVNDYANIQPGQKAIIGKDSSNYGYYVRGTITEQNGKPNVSNAVSGGYIDNGYYYGYNMTGYLSYLTNWAYVDEVARYTNKSVAVQNAVIMQALRAGHVKPITADTQVQNGEIVAGSPVVIRLPAVLPLPAESVQELPAVQEKIGVVPVSDDVTDTVQQLQTEQAQLTGDTSAFALDLTGYFPFCIPFDIGNLLGAFVAAPEAPVIPFIFPVGYEDGEIVMETYYMDLSAFDSVAYWCRKGELDLFIVGLGVVTRQWFLRG